MAAAGVAMTVGARHCERERRNPVGDWRGVSGFRAWERIGGHQLDRFTFVRDDGCEGCACGGHASLRDDGRRTARLLPRFRAAQEVRAGRRAVRFGGVIAR